MVALLSFYPSRMALKGTVSRQLAQDNMFIDAISPTERGLKRHK